MKGTDILRTFLPGDAVLHGDSRACSPHTGPAWLDGAGTGAGWPCCPGCPGRCWPHKSAYLDRSRLRFPQQLLSCRGRGSAGARPRRCGPAVLQKGPLGELLPLLRAQAPGGLFPLVASTFPWAALVLAVPAQEPRFPCTPRGRRNQLAAGAVSPCGSVKLLLEWERRLVSGSRRLPARLSEEGNVACTS